jgi:hypothetical protein
VSVRRLSHLSPFEGELRRGMVPPVAKARKIDFMKQEKKTVYVVKTAVDGAGARFSDKGEAEKAVEALERTGYKKVRILPKRV